MNRTPAIITQLLVINLIFFVGSHVALNGAKNSAILAARI